MRNLFCFPAIGAALALLSSTVRAQSQEAIISLVGHRAPMYLFIVFAIVVGVSVYFMRTRDRRAAPLTRLFESGRTVHSVGPDATVADCVRRMADAKIGAVVVMEADRLIGIFTERDALNRVLAAGRDPGRTKITEVMTRDPHCISPTTTVGDAMVELVMQRRFRHLPVVDNGRVLAVVSSGDLTHWLVKGQLGAAETIVDVAART